MASLGPAGLESTTVMAPIIEENREAIVALCKRYGITRLDVFGSAARGTDFDPATSDADFFYDADTTRDTHVDDFFDFIRDMEQLLGRSIDLVTVHPRHPNPYFLLVANRDRKTLYAA
jgi:uncharacterized protein